MIRCLVNSIPYRFIFICLVTKKGLKFQQPNGAIEDKIEINVKAK